ncbi:thioredoxin family protein [Solitalea koreensis]|uniref:Thioredoxin n=1 Tax=Solitalea koreensis TaxID=543615 RepID=A0A521C5E2_9SPHI|nr:thioredoxin family protein [Solitalea koreensis]SMO54737.1 Thioredoxin [Solitalea koreensis]
MKKTVVLFVAILGCLSSAYAQEAPASKEGIQFFEGTWSQALAKSKETGKPIFIDVYTTWCGPCKMMAKEIFPKKEVGDKYNAAFINYSIDAEKGEGKELAKKYAVRAYPTFLYVKADEELVYRGAGYNPDPKPFLDLADRAIEETKNPITLSQLEKEYADGKREKEFLTTLLKRKAALELADPKLLDDVIATLSNEEIVSAELAPPILKSLTTSDCKAFELVLANLEKFPSKPIAENALVQAITSDWRVAIKDKNEALFNKILVNANRIPNKPAYFEEMMLQYKLKYFTAMNNISLLMEAARELSKEGMNITAEKIAQKNKEQYDKVMQPFFDGKRDSTKVQDFSKMKEYYQTAYSKSLAGKLNIAAWSLIEAKVADKKLLQEGLTWSEKSLVLHKDVPNYIDTKAQILYRMGKKTEGIALEEKAHALDPQNKEWPDVIQKMKDGTL